MAPLSGNNASSLDQYVNRQYVHSRLTSSITPQCRDLVDYVAVVYIFQSAFEIGMEKNEKPAPLFQFDGIPIQEIDATRVAAHAVYDLGYEVGRIIDDGLKETGNSPFQASLFLSQFEIILENLTTFFRPDAEITKSRKANRSDPRIAQYLPSDQIM